jgi:hypothetical protein
VIIHGGVNGEEIPEENHYTEKMPLLLRICAIALRILIVLPNPPAYEWQEINFIWSLGVKSSTIDKCDVYIRRVCRECSEVHVVLENIIGVDSSQIERIGSIG